MIIDIEDDLFYKIKELMKNRSKSIYEQLEEIKPLEIKSDDNSLIKARTIKTQRVKENIKETIKSLYELNISPSKYQIHKRTGIAYVTINKYYDEILEDFKRQVKSE